MASVEKSWFSKIDDTHFQYNGNEADTDTCHASLEMKDAFSHNGFLIVKNLFSQETTEKVRKALEESDAFNKAAFSLKDTEQMTFSQSHWVVPGDDIVGLAARTEKVVTICEDLLNRREIYLYSGKVIMKQPFTGGALIWHQDYGYWYNNRALFPDFVSCFIALTKNDRENGGLQVLKGSHLCGRIDHGPQAGQQGADTERVQLIEKVLPHVYCDLKPGDAIFFHANLLHQSDINRSEFKRWNLIFSYCSKDNSPDLPHYNAIYTEKLQKVPVDAVEKCEDLQIQPRDYLDPRTNQNINVDA